jgi:hypothetical protein
MRSVLYGAVDFTALLPTSIDRAYGTPATVPTGTSSMDRYVFSDTGGRGGATYAWLLYPTVTPIGTLVLSYSAHSSGFNSSDFAQSAANATFLAQGCHVLCCDQPCYGLGSNNPNPTTLDGGNSNGHNFSALTEGTESFWRIFLDAAVGGSNQAIADVAPTRIVAIGLSGGGLCVGMLAAMDTRIQASYAVMSSRYWPEQYALGEWTGSADEWEYNIKSAVQTPENGGYPRTRHALRSDNGRRGVLVCADLDSIYPSLGHHALIDKGAAEINRMLSGAGSFAVRYDTAATTHGWTSQTTAWIWADIIAHVA